jgi:hypothetical protein
MRSYAKRSPRRRSKGYPRVAHQTGTQAGKLVTGVEGPQNTGFVGRRQDAALDQKRAPMPTWKRFVFTPSPAHTWA